ncbi:single-stranded DNA-binding protein [Lacticaseibacillus sharpeae]|uniref:single-stranded DNA-binding protein n=1 Tax=Lacticaseibacillus sharpeae TaxID=1626 RepID=UPI0006D2A120|nr:single-stranded DNA-binding protein [Lacticaseibacillus sharpeae]
MAYLNDVKVLGHLSRDLKGRVSNAQTGTKSFASSTIAVSRHTANGDFTDFLPIKAWGKAADVLHEYTVKGSMLLLEGQLQAGDHGRDIFIGVTNVQLLETKEHTAELRQKVSDEEAQRASGNAAASQDPYASSGNSYAAASREHREHRPRKVMQRRSTVVRRPQSTRVMRQPLSQHIR